MHCVAEVPVPAIKLCLLEGDAALSAGVIHADQLVFPLFTKSLQPHINACLQPACQGLGPKELVFPLGPSCTAESNIHSSPRMKGMTCSRLAVWCKAQQWCPGMALEVNTLHLGEGRGGNTLHLGEVMPSLLFPMLDSHRGDDNLHHTPLLHQMRNSGIGGVPSSSHVLDEPMFLFLPSHCLSRSRHTTLMLCKKWLAKHWLISSRALISRVAACSPAPRRHSRWTLQSCNLGNSTLANSTAEQSWRATLAGI